MLRLIITSISLIILALLLYPQMLYLLLLTPLMLLSSKVREKTKEAAGICATALQSSAKKEERKGRILELLEERGELTNEEAREALGVSARTIIRYMDELEKKGTVEQVGDTGRGVRYRLKN